MTMRLHKYRDAARRHPALPPRKLREFSRTNTGRGSQTGISSWHIFAREPCAPISTWFARKLNLYSLKSYETGSALQMTSWLPAMTYGLIRLSATWSAL